MNDANQNNDRQIKFIVVDDEDIVLSLVRDALEDSGYHIELAGSSREALEKIEKEYFDFILTDIRMPDCNGIELVKKARLINPSLGVIFMTGYANLGTAKDAIKEGAYDYIMKPFELDEMRQAVKNAVVKKRKDSEKVITGELNRLSDLNQLMYTVGDRKSLVRLSLGFALMQSKAPRGCIIFRTDRENEIGIISTDKLSDIEFNESFKRFDKDYFDLSSDELNAPFFTEAVSDHPLYKEFRDEAIEEIVIPSWHTEGTRLINIALKGSRKLYGFLIIGFSEDSDSLKGSAIKFLSITANQIAISLENIALLEETRTAYRHLKDLQDQTIQLEKMATKGQLSAEIGHELNNFLGVVTGNLSLMEHHLAKGNYEELDKFLKIAMVNLGNIKKFSDGLMDLSAMSVSMEPCDINNVINDTIEFLSTQNRFNNVKINFTPTRQTIFTKADIGQLQQLLYNLIYNSADALNEKPLTDERKIEISTTIDSGGKNFSISVSDNGVGIPDEYIDIAFKERFTTKRRGHGLGLLVCRRIINNHKGQLSINSNPGQGTTIKITIPVVSVTSPQEVEA
ncbi:MAG TPA: response regulator [candidate division Zixibacteria bacterium]|nr:response regulator [candidate division Zixibacteria bacterium]